MKKLILSIFFIAATPLLTYADQSDLATNCLDFEAGTLCIQLSKIDSDTYQVSKYIENAQNSSMTLSCDILTPDNKMQNLGKCNRQFDYNDNGERTVKFYINLENEFKSQAFEVNFSDYQPILARKEALPEYSVEDEVNQAMRIDQRDSIDWFSAAERADVKAVYKLWPLVIQKLEKKYPKLINNINWQNKQQILYEQTRLTLTNDVNKKYDTYEKYYNAVISFVEYTIEQKKK